jgi:hypothetical protein
VAIDLAPKQAAGQAFPEENRVRSGRVERLEGLAEAGLKVAGRNPSSRIALSWLPQYVTPCAARIPSRRFGGSLNMGPITGPKGTASLVSAAGNVNRGGRRPASLATRSTQRPDRRKLPAKDVGPAGAALVVDQQDPQGEVVDVEEGEPGLRKDLDGHPAGAHLVDEDAELGGTPGPYTPPGWAMRIGPPRSIRAFASWRARYFVSP